MSAPIRTLMFASANDPVRSLKAIAIGASAVCLDLEDAVARRRPARRSAGRPRSARRSRAG